MKKKTAELIGAALDWAVADIEFKRMMAAGEHVKDWVLVEHNLGRNTDPYSTDWLWGGPIIEREGISVLCNHRAIPESRDAAWRTADWFATACRASNRHHGTTPLVAAMRCYVASKLDDEIEIPEVLA